MTGSLGPLNTSFAADLRMRFQQAYSDTYPLHDFVRRRWIIFCNIALNVL